MTSIIRRDPFELPRLSRMFNSAFSDPFFAELLPATDEGTLAVDVSEDDDNVFVRASLPGFRKEDVDVEIHDGVLTLKAEHTEEQEQKGERFYRRERRFGSLNRRVALPSPVIESEARAELRDGVLTLRVPKAQEARPKRIAID